ncbi:MAG TPA: hypothetical protein VLW26_13645 [Steroidobacteraceae bacterium]|nr:hypothetical protein [Steroidobacteraceae bacterium]
MGIVRHVLLTLAIVASAGCASTAQQSVASADSSSSCRAVGTVQENSWPSLSHMDIQDLKSQSVGTTGTVVYGTSANHPGQGTTFRCDPGSLPR